MGFVSASDGLRDGRQRIIRSRSWVLAGTVRVSVHANMGLNSFSGLLPSAFACHADDSMPAWSISRPGLVPCLATPPFSMGLRMRILYESITVNGQLCKWRRLSCGIILSSQAPSHVETLRSHRTVTRAVCTCEWSVTFWRVSHGELHPLAPALFFPGHVQLSVRWSCPLLLTSFFRPADRLDPWETAYRSFAS